MKKNYKTLIFVIAVGMMLFSCQSNDLDKTLLYGKWKGADWLLEGNSTDFDAHLVHFSFADDDNYLADFGGTQKEIGTYRLEGDKLYTTAKGKKEKVVRLVTLNQDSIVMDMNRSGRDEVLILVRE